MSQTQARLTLSPVPQAPVHRRADIQGLRAIAVIMVVAFHARLPIPGGFTGVDVFFVISGFVITAMLHREFAQRGTISLGTFYARRFLRLTPALALLVACVAVASALLQSPFGSQQATAQTGMGAMLLSANFVIAIASGDYFASSAKFNPLLNTWSLSVEEQFYLVFPTMLLIGWLIARKTRWRPAALWLVLPVMIASFVLCLQWSMGVAQAPALEAWLGGPQSAAFYFSPARAWEFGVGSLLALALARWPRVPGSVARWAGLLGIGMILVAAFGLNDRMAFPGMIALIPVIGTSLVILAGSGNRTAVSRTLSIRPLVWTGNISYSWYLWHWPAIVFAVLLLPATPRTYAAAALASLLPAIVSYSVVEQPLRRWRPRSWRRGAFMALVTLGVPLALCAALLQGAQLGWGVYDTRTVGLDGDGAVSLLDDPVAQDDPMAQDDPAAAGGPALDDTGSPDAPAGADQGAAGADGLDTAPAGDPSRSDLRAAHEAIKRGCVNVALDPKRCSWGPANPRGTVLLAGDSQAYALADGVIPAAAELGYRTIVSSRLGCPFLARESTGGNDLPCPPWQNSVLDYALRVKPDVVIIANRSGSYVRPGAKWRMIETASGGVPASAQQARESYDQALTQVVRALRSRGIGVVIVGAVPEMTGYIDQRSLLSGVFSAPPFTVGRADSEEYRAPAFTAEQSLAAADPGVISFDPIPMLCDDRECATRVGDEIRYQDETHLSVSGALLLASGLRASIAAAELGAKSAAAQVRAP